MSEDKLPISEKLTVLDSVILYKTSNWWSAVALIDSFGRKQIATYLWLNKNGTWKRQQKFVIKNKEEWTKVREAIEKFLPNL